MGKFMAFLYGLVAYLAFAVTIVYAIGFVTGLVVPKTIDSGAVVPLTEAIVVNLLLMSLFAVQHSVMARPQFKKWWTQFVPQSPSSAAPLCCFQASRCFCCSGNGGQSRQWCGR